MSNEIKMRVPNPFMYSTPDQIKEPERAISLFVDVFKDFYSVESPGNTFINGPRGSGKSMMFRIMKPDCQKIRLDKKLKELSYFGVYIPVKNSALDITELEYLINKHGENIYNEHLMTTYFMLSIFDSLRAEELQDEAVTEVMDFYNNSFLRQLRNCNYTFEVAKVDSFHSVKGIFNSIILLLEDNLELFSTFIQSLPTGNFEYKGPLFLYRNFLSPLVKAIRNFSFLPDSPLYLMIDDADLLNLSQTAILNSWVSYRSSSVMCFKITTQLNYKTYTTSSGANKIDSPHDFYEINLSDIYTSNPKGRYKDNVKLIVEKRLLQISKITTTAEEFFESNQEQEERIRTLFNKYQKDKGYDFAYRNARIDYMLSMTNEYTYSYSGFEQLVHLSSGIIRNFIDLSFKMFDEALRKKEHELVLKSIPVAIQDQEIRSYSDWLLLQLDKPIDDEKLQPLRKDNYRMLKTLINSIGKAFRVFLESDSSERKKYSFYFDGELPPEIKEVLKLGVSDGYLHYSTHGSKTGLGRSHKYVLNRMLSPIYKLDPFTFSGYLYLTPDKVELAVRNEKKFLEYIKDRIQKGDKTDEEKQLEFDF